MFKSARKWIGEKLIHVGFRLLCIDVKSIATQVEEENDDRDDGLPNPVVTLSPEAQRMIADAAPIPRVEPKAEPPLKGSAAERLQKARAQRSSL